MPRPGYRLAPRARAGYAPSCSSYGLGGRPCTEITTLRRPFEPTSKRRRGFPLASPTSSAATGSSASTPELTEKLGRDDPCPCGSGQRFSPVLSQHRPVRRHARELLRARPSPVAEHPPRLRWVRSIAAALPWNASTRAPGGSLAPRSLVDSNPSLSQPPSPTNGAAIISSPFSGGCSASA
jgi:hypothetical protein